ncbi:MAG: hypothetical protein ACJAQ6_001941 [Arenicella sp.]|jgi:hypothetical protein
MIISHKHRYIFFAIPKTATHSVREALHHYSADGDWQQQLLFTEQTIPLPEIAEIKHGHISVQQLEPAIDPAQWHSYFRFAFVRNPFDRFVSTCAFLNRQNPRFQANSLLWMKMALERPVFRARILAIPQSDLLTDANGQLGVDFIGRYETLQASMDTVFEHLGLPSVELRVRNPSEHAHYREYYDDHLRALVENFYQADLQRFNYTF